MDIDSSGFKGTIYSIPIILLSSLTYNTVIALFYRVEECKQLASLSLYLFCNICNCINVNLKDDRNSILPFPLNNIFLSSEGNFKKNRLARCAFYVLTSVIA